MLSDTQVRGLLPRGHAAASGARRTIELDDVAKQAPTNGQIHVWDAARYLWVPRALASTDVPNVPRIVADATARTALTGLTDGQIVFQADTELLYQWDADAGGSWRGVRSAGDSITSVAISDATINASPWTVWGSAVSAGQPDVPVNAIALFTGKFEDFSNIVVAQMRLGISIDGGSNWTYGGTVEDVFGQGGNNYNRGPISNSHQRSNVTATGAIQARAEANSTFTSTNGRAGQITLFLKPA